MAYWIFKLADQRMYPDILGKEYVYDNTHSIRVAQGDIFLYLDKTEGYSFTATGLVRKISTRSPNAQEAQRTENVRLVYTAHLSEVIRFSKSLSISPRTTVGKRNRARLGIVDVNLLGWSQSMPSICEAMYLEILDLAEMRNLVPPGEEEDDGFSVPDTWGKTKTRGVVKRFSEPVLARSNSTCIVCGSSMHGMVEAAHLSPYASDKKNRANPANGVCLCKYCHRALDLRAIAIRPDGVLLVSRSVKDAIALHHFSIVSPEERKKWLVGVDPDFLLKTVLWYEESLEDEDAKRIS